jgi:hypothetical protein
MNGKIEFVSNYSDLSTEKGFQFEFNCDRCSNGFRTRFRVWTAGPASSLLDAAGSLLGGVFNTAADVGERARRTSWQSAHDEAYLESVQEIRTQFMQCPRCSQWVCRKACWSSRRGLCRDCAADPGAETSAPPSHGEQETGPQACANCGAPLPARAKFCSECGAKVA